MQNRKWKCTLKGTVDLLTKGPFTQAIWVGDFAQQCNFKIEKSVSNRNRQRQVLIVLTDACVNTTLGSLFCNTRK
jgi:hypothetical protein